MQRDDRRCFFLAEKVWQLSEHFLREVTDIFVGPSPRLRQREDRRQLLCRNASSIEPTSFGISGMILSIGMGDAASIRLPVSITQLRHVEVQMQSHSK